MNSTEAIMDRIIQANIDRYKLLLKTETDVTKRTVILQLLADEAERLGPAIDKKKRLAIQK
jgi:hypothetical protein